MWKKGVRIDPRIVEKNRSRTQDAHRFKTTHSAVITHCVSE